MPTHLKASLTLMLAVFWALAAMLAEKPKPPKFLRAPYIMSERDDLRVEVQIVPHPQIRTVLLELWHSDPVANEFDPDASPAFPCEPRRLVRSSLEPVTELNAAQRTFSFHWRGPFQPGPLVLITRCGIGRGLTTGTTRRCVEIS
mgnify:CR=1 FL=1